MTPPRRARARKKPANKLPSKPPWKSARLAPLVLALIACLVAGAAAWAYFGAGPPAPQGRSTDLVLAPGSHLPSIAHALRRAGVVRAPLVFMVAAELTGAAGRLKAGEYRFASGASVDTVLSMIRKGEVVRHFVTIPEGLTSRAAAAVLDNAAELTGTAPIPAEGALLPETYEVRWGEPRVRVLRRMMDARDKLLANLWRTRRPGLPYRSPGDAVTLASIVEKETAKVEERPHIAAVFLNRLANGVRLESDPTVVYGLSGGAPLGHGLRVSELQTLTPYNTYLVAGLPPTPIANPGRAALAAALNPTHSADLYFVADGTGGHVFSDTFATHLKNVARWRAIEQARAAGGTTP